jgi:hypothetical protein
VQRLHRFNDCEILSNFGSEALERLRCQVPLRPALVPLIGREAEEYAEDNE